MSGEDRGGWILSLGIAFVVGIVVGAVTFSTHTTETKVEYKDPSLAPVESILEVDDIQLNGETCLPKGRYTGNGTASLCYTQAIVTSYDLEDEGDYRQLVRMRNLELIPRGNYSKFECGEEREVRQDGELLHERTLHCDVEVRIQQNRCPTFSVNDDLVLGEKNGYTCLYREEMVE